LKAVDEHAELLRESAAAAGNDHRLGANEAPPAIVSVYLGEQLEDVLAQLVSTGSATSSIKGAKLDTGVRTLPDFAKDATDRNRTAPLAFTGNKFEFRMVGARDSVATSTIVLNTIVAQAFSEACDYLESVDDFESGVHELIKKFASEHERIVFNGNGYSQEWVEEAERRGLPNIRTTVESIQYLTTDKTIKLFEDFGVFTRTELESRAEIKYETYAKIINIEAKTMIDITSKQIIPAVIKYITSLAHSVNEVKGVCEFVDVSVQTELLEMASDLLAKTRNALHKLIEVTMRAAKMKRGRKQAEFFKDEVVPAMEALRGPVDELEMIVDKDIWPMPSYGDLLFEV
jgi:glutamine synthetase